ncbi:hypothetical protein C1646_603096, partial [Rhizophagus diaphanus]
LVWWIHYLPFWNGRSLIQEDPKTVIYTDASNTGWDVSWGKLTIHGRWTLEESQLHINILELKAIQFAIMLY